METGTEEKKPLERWNSADTTLLCAALCFLAAVGFRNLYSDSVLAEGFLFVTEAALVGGIADWFAVTALFKKPLGFPFHTAILPNRREEFINASTFMVQQEFFSRKTLFKKIGNLRLIPVFVEYLEKPATQQFLLNEFLNALKKYIKSSDKDALSKTIANKIRREFENLPAQELIQDGGKWLRDSGKDKELFKGLVQKLKETAAKPETRTKLQAVLEKFAAEKTAQSSGAFSLLMMGFAQMLNLVNFEEAATIMQTQLLKLLNELLSDSPFQQKTFEECRLKISELTDTAEFKDLVERLQIDLSANLPIEENIDAALSKFEQQILSVNVKDFENLAQDSAETKNLGMIFVKILFDLYNQFVELLKIDSEIKTSLEKFIYELTARAALYAQPLIGNIAKSALNRMSVDQLNNLVYGKAEPDFIWIRLNGSIVGSFIGLVIFLIIKAIS